MALGALSADSIRKILQGYVAWMYAILWFPVTQAKKADGTRV